MSWAAGRETTREQDIAYCLLSLLEVNMPLIYGEGPRAFERLQEEVMKTSTDHSLFSWQETGAEAGAEQGPLARSPISKRLKRTALSSLVKVHKKVYVDLQG